jgi:hypothetical protein
MRTRLSVIYSYIALFFYLHLADSPHLWRATTVYCPPLTYLIAQVETSFPSVWADMIVKNVACALRTSV